MSEFFDLKKSQYELDFVDIDIDKDLPLFLDSYFIKKIKTPFGEEATYDIKTFSDFFMQLLKSGLKKEAEALFGFLGEPNETCLGLSRKKPRGRGIGTEDAKKIFNRIISSKALNVLDDLEDIRVFVSGIDKDKISDMVTNIIRGQLIRYTQNQCHLWGIPLATNVPTGYTWNRKELVWEEYFDDMLIIRDQKILLVPKHIVSFSKEYTPQNYRQHFVLNFLQEKHLKENSSLVQLFKRKDGSERRFVTKKSIIANEVMDKDYLVKFTVRHPEVFKNFKDNTKINLCSLSNEDITFEVIGEVIEYLRKFLLEIPAGAENATLYHRTVTGILELLFYPNLTSPCIEREIHEGRKRIDIVFENNAEGGFFFKLPTIHRIPSSSIMVECKNYSHDLANPELDQIAGRFNVNRGQFGLILCRDIVDMELFIKRCKDTCRDGRGVIIPLIDEDLILALNQFIEKGQNAVESIIQTRFMEVIGD